VFTSWLLSFIAISSIALLQQFVFYDMGFMMVIGPWGAASVLLFAAPGTYFWQFSSGPAKVLDCLLSVWPVCLVELATAFVAGLLISF
jgi:hypothetical protein